jgi:Zn-finger nucleic acid-binding protein
MNCPKCNVTLSMTDRQGVEIDFCPQCRGIWLDRGELDKIIERAGPAVTFPSASAHHNSSGAPPLMPSPERDHRRRDDDDDDDYQHRRSDGSYDPRRKKKKGFLGDLFDF